MCLRGGVWRPLHASSALAGPLRKEETVISSLCSYLGEMKALLLLEKNPMLLVPDRSCFYLDCFRREKPALIFEVLERLSHLRRFDMAVMFMSGPERKRKFQEAAFPAPPPHALISVLPCTIYSESDTDYASSGKQSAVGSSR